MVAASEDTRQPLRERLEAARRNLRTATERLERGEPGADDDVATARAETRAAVAAWVQAQVVSPGAWESAQVVDSRTPDDLGSSGYVMKEAAAALDAVRNLPLRLRLRRMRGGQQLVTVELAVVDLLRTLGGGSAE